jgi:hypothetical protein
MTDGVEVVLLLAAQPCFEIEAVSLGVAAFGVGLAIPSFGAAAAFGGLGGLAARAPASSWRAARAAPASGGLDEIALVVEVVAVLIVVRPAIGGVVGAVVARLVEALGCTAATWTAPLLLALDVLHGGRAAQRVAEVGREPPALPFFDWSSLMPDENELSSRPNERAMVCPRGPSTGFDILRHQ